MSYLEAEHDDRPQPGRALTTRDEGATMKTIVVNGREHRFPGEEIGRGELALLAFPHVGAVGPSALTIAYDHGPSEAPCGLLAAGRQTRILDGQTFSVSLTDKS